MEEWEYQEAGAIGAISVADYHRPVCVVLQEEASALSSGKG